MNVSIALDNNVLVPAYVMLKSLVTTNTTPDINIYVLESSLTEQDKDFLSNSIKNAGNASLHFLHIEESATEGLPTNQFWSKEMYYRLMLPELLPNEDRILYLDVDMIVNKDISEFYSVEFENDLLIGSKDQEFENILNDPELPPKRKASLTELSNKGMIYICSGMLLMDLSGLRKEGYYFRKYVEIFNTIKDWVTLPDQDLINYVHYDRVGLVDENTFGVFAQTAHSNGRNYSDLKENTYIIHFTGKAKPWTINLVRYDIEKIWWEYAKLCPFYFELMEKVFTDSMESSFTENKINELVAESNELRELIFKMKSLIPGLD